MIDFWNSTVETSFIFRVRDGDFDRDRKGIRGLIDFCNSTVGTSFIFRVRDGDFDRDRCLFFLGLTSNSSSSTRGNSFEPDSKS